MREETVRRYTGESSRIYILRQEGSCHVDDCGSVEQVHQEIEAALSEQHWVRGIGEYAQQEGSEWIFYVPEDWGYDNFCRPPLVTIRVWQSEHSSGYIDVELRTYNRSPITDFGDCMG